MGVMVFAIACVMGCSGKKDKSKEVRIQPVHGTIRSSVITTGMVEPQNRLEIKVETPDGNEKNRRPKTADGAQDFRQQGQNEE